VKRISQEPGYLLHHYDWSESSLILEVFTRHHGRVALVARGAKRPTSNFRPVLLPLQGLRLSFGDAAEIRNLKAAEWGGGLVMPTGAALLAGYYLNELLMRLLARDDPHERLFDAYADVVRVLASSPGSDWPWALRAFELLLLREIGVLPSLAMQTSNLAALQDESLYLLTTEAGLRAAQASESGLAITGVQWKALQAALDAAEPLPALARAALPVLPALKTQLRALLHQHCGVAELQTRKLLRELHDL